MTVAVFTTTGSGSWTVPAGVTSVQVECWGGGDGKLGTEGGGGAYSQSTLTVTAGATISYYVARGGSTDAQTYSFNAEDTWFQSSTNVMAKGASGATGGQASAGYGTLKYSGGNGGSSRGGGGAAASPNGNGANGTVGNPSGGTAGNGGSSPGAGAGGSGSGNGAGSAGASNADGGGGGGGSLIGGSGYGGAGGLPGGGRGSAGNTGGTEIGARGQIRLTYADGSGTGTPATATRRRLSPTASG